MRLQPIEEPKGLLTKAAYRYSFKRFGRVLTPLKTVHARVRGSMAIDMAINRFLSGKTSLDKHLVYLIKSIVATANGCSFCVDIALAEEIRSGMQPKEVQNPEGIFTETELAAMAFAREATVAREVRDETFNRLQHFFSEREIAEITLVIAIEHYYNMINIPLGIESDGLCTIAQDMIGKKNGRG